MRWQAPRASPVAESGPWLMLALGLGALFVFTVPRRDGCGEASEAQLREGPLVGERCGHHWNRKGRYSSLPMKSFFRLVTCASNTSETRRILPWCRTSLCHCL